MRSLLRDTINQSKKLQKLVATHEFFLVNEKKVVGQMDGNQIKDYHMRKLKA